MKINLKELVVFAILGDLMFISKVILDALPNIHLVGVLIVAITAVYRLKAIYPISVFIFLTGIYGGFSLWWIPYLYIWFVLWGFTMLLPKKMPCWFSSFVYIAVCGLHGFLFGTLYAPFQALAFGLSFKGMIAWIIAGLPYDAIHGVSNCICGLLIVPIIFALKRAERLTHK